MEKQKFLTPSQFNRLPRAKRAVLIAEDVLNQLKANKYDGSGGCYVKFNSTANKSQDASEVIKSGNFSCTVCARGALFISALKFKNVLRIREIQNEIFSYGKSRSKGTKYISTEFNNKQQSFIESTYEGRHWGNISESEFETCNKFRLRYEQKVKKLKRCVNFKEYILKEICKNIIRNNGTFKP